MRWQRTSAVVVALGLVLGGPSVGRAGWLTLTTGVAGAAEPFATAELWFDFPATPPVVAVNQLGGTGTVQATTDGGTTHFGGLGVPVLLNLSDGTAYLAAGEPPAGATGRTPTGVKSGSAASVAPGTGATIPDGAALLGIAVADRDAGGRTLTVSLTGQDGAALGTGTIDIPTGGWWVVGLGPDAKPGTGPVEEPGNGGETPNEGSGPPPGVPEPTTLVLGLLGATLFPWRRGRAGS
ncbi:hypothetical protein J0H58_37425 [bacterium]|nr:hypothetical protein [bacterium]